MNTFLVLHTYKDKSRIEEGVNYFNTEGAPALAVAVAEGKTPAKALKTRTPYPYGRNDYVFCLWEAEPTDDILMSLSVTRLLHYVTFDAMQVDEVDWAAVAESMKAHAIA